MSRRRYISTDISTDERVDLLAEEAGEFAVLLYTWMIPHAADDATFTGKPREVLLTVVPGLRSRTVADVTAALDAMDRLGLVAWDREAGRLTFPPAAFYKYQTYIKHENRRASSAARRPPMVAPENADERRETPQKGASLSHSPTSPVPPPLSHPVPVSADADTGAGVREAAPPAGESAAAKPPKYSAAFEAFFRRSPRNESKLDAYREWQKLRPTGELADAILAGLERWHLSDQWANRGVYPHASTWLHNRKWEDEPAPATAALPARASPGGRQNGKPTTLDLIRATMGATGEADDDRRGARPGHGHVVARLAAPGDGRGDDDGDQSALWRAAGRPG